MAIVTMSRFSLLLMKQDADRVLHELQRFGDVHFKQSVPPEEDDLLTPVPARDTEDIIKKRDAIKRLIGEIQWFEKLNRWQFTKAERKVITRAQMRIETMTFEELETRAAQVDIDGILGSMEEAGSLLDGEAASKVQYYIEPWHKRKIPAETLVQIREAEPIIGTVDAEFEEDMTRELRATRQIFAIVAKEKDGSILYIMKPSIDHEQNAKNLAEKYHMQARSLQSVKMRSELLQVQHKIDKMLSLRHRTDGSLERVATHKQDLMVYYEYLQNLLLREEEYPHFLQTETTVLMEGWVPAEHAARLETLIADTCKDQHVIKTEVVPKVENNAPVVLRNNKLVTMFESITMMYSMPQYNEIDPTPVFTPFYLFFFGMMLADIGYGLIMLVATLTVMLTCKLKPSTDKFIRFLFYLSFPVIAWGFVYGSFFGGVIEMTPLINNNSEYMRVMIMSLGFGVVHLFTALAVKAVSCFKRGDPWGALFDVGFWYMVLIGSLCLILQTLVPELAPYSNIFMWLAIIGGVGILLTNGRKDAKTPPGKLAQGLYSLYGITGYIGDIVSYARLMALGLSGGSIGIAINMIVGMLSQNGIVGIFFGAIVFVGVHMFNMGISGLSAYVHSSRLIYVEFFGKFYTGGGLPYKPFRAKNTYVNII